MYSGPWQVAQLVGALSHTPKSCRIDTRLGHVLRLWVYSQSGCVWGQPIHASHTDVSLSFSFSLPTAHPSSLCKINNHILR